MGFRDMFNTVKSGLSDVMTNLNQATQQPPLAPSSPAPQINTPTASAPPKKIDTTGPGFEPVSGVSLENYVNLLALMSDVGEDEAKCAAIAEENGVSRPDWEAVKEGWTARMSDPALESVRQAFVPLYAEAMDKKRGGKEPMTLEEYVHIFAEISFRKDPLDNSKQVDREVVLKENNLTANKWNEVLFYWSPKVSDQHNPVYSRYSALLRMETDRILKG